MVGLEYHWRKDDFDRLGHVIELIANGPHADLYGDYLGYLKLKHQGRRKEALAAADHFAASYKGDPFEIRQRVCWSLIELTEPYWDSWPAMGSWLFPGNIQIKLVNPMFEEWRLLDPRNVNAWLYPLGHGLEWGAETAFMLEPNNPRCQYAELTRLLPRIGFAVHELDHIGVVLDPPDKFSGVVDSLVMVTEAIGKNLTDEVQETLNWLRALMQVHAETKGDLRPMLAELGIVEPEYPALYQTKLWFRDIPQVGDR
jgi:hypothetical protein